MPWAAAAMVGGALIGASASKSAAKTGAAAANKATDATLEQYYQNREDLMPWREAGMGALDQLKTGLSPGGDFNRDFTAADFQKDPGYQFRMDEGLGAVQSSAAARGGVLGGRTLKELSRYGQDYASGEYTNAYNRFNADRTQRFNRLSGLAGTSQTAANNIANQGTNATSAANEYNLQGANARASGYVGAANAVNNGVSSLSNFYQQQQLINQMKPQQWYGSGGSSPYRGSVSDSITLSDGSTFS